MAELDEASRATPQSRRVAARTHEQRSNGSLPCPFAPSAAHLIDCHRLQYITELDEAARVKPGQPRNARRIAAMNAKLQKLVSASYTMPRKQQVA
jgi:hypothetical protein